MARAKKDYKRINVRLNRDAAELLDRYCAANRFEMTFAIENLIRLSVPMLLGRLERKVAKQSEKEEAKA